MSQIAAKDAPVVKSVHNAKQMPKIFYGLHFYPGVAQYPGMADNGEPSRILVTEDSIRNMEPTFAGKPIYVDHIEGAPRLATLEYEADGYVIESFFNKADGKHWAKMLIVSDEGHEAIAKGWKLSNAYKPSFVPKDGVWNSIPYQHELVGGEFEHMALVATPRYNESIILTPKEFSTYNERCLEAVKRVDNKAAESLTQTPAISKKEGAIAMLSSFFKKTPVEADKDALVTLKNGKTVSIEDLIAIANEGQPETQPAPVLGGAANAEEKEEKDKSEDGEAKDKPKAESKEEKTEQGDAPDKDKSDAIQLCNPDHHVTVNGGTMKLSDMMKEHEHMKNCMNALSEHWSKMGAAKAKEDATLNSEPKKEEAPAKIENKSADDDDDFFNGIFGEKPGDRMEALKNAHLDVPAIKEVSTPAPIAASGVALGKLRYGTK